MVNIRRCLASKGFSEKHTLYLWLPILICCIYYLLKSYNFYIHDFANYYFGAYAIANNFFHTEIYDALLFNQGLLEEGFDFLYVSFYPNTPFIAFFFLPFSILPWQEAKLAFNLISIFLFLFSLYRFLKYYKVNPVIIIFIPLIFFITIKNNILFGQPYFLLFFFLAEGLLFYEKGKKIKTSLYWAIAILLKVFPVLLFFWLLIKKDFKSMLYLSLGCCLLLLFSLPFCGLETWMYYIQEVFPKSSSGIIYDSFTPKAKSALMLFKNLFVYDAMLNPSPWIDNEYLFHVAQIIYKVSILSICAFVSIRYKKQAIIPFSFWMVASLMLGPTNSSYSKIFLLFPLVALLKDDLSIRNSKIMLGLFLILLICNIPMHYFYELPLLMKFPRVYLMIFLFVFLYYQFPAKINGIALTALFVLFFLMTFSTFRPNNRLPDYAFLDKKMPAILADYGSKQGHLYYTEWIKGSNKTTTTTLAINKLDSINVNIIDNQIYIKGQQISHSPDHKRKARIVNDTMIFYLTDINRGTGFYTLRKIKINY